MDIKNKRGQTMSLPFTMIFSIILVAVVIFVGFFAIKMFLERAEQVELNSLVKGSGGIEETVIYAWQSSGREQTDDFDCSDKIDMICFVDFSLAAKGKDKNLFNELKDYNDEANFFYYPLMEAEKYDSFSDWQIRCGNKDCLTVKETRNPLCIEVINSKVTFTLIKEFGSSKVIVSSSQ